MQRLPFEKTSIKYQNKLKMKKIDFLKPAFITILLVIATTSFAANLQKTILYFDKDKSMLTVAEKQKIKDVAESDVIFLYGHTDSDGDNAYNLRLSEKRVKEVAKLIASISPDKKLDMQYFGETEALNANKDEAEKTLNRRVEVVFISDPVLSFKTEKQKFTIDNSKDQTITCKEGTVIEIPKGAFENKMIEIEVSEHYQPLEILSENLTTVSDGKPLQTQGMIHIAAFENGKTVQSSKEITYKFPKKDKVNDDYEFFSGVRNSDYEMNWKIKENEEEITEKVGDDTSYITSLCTASQDIYMETETQFYKMRDKIQNFKYNSMDLVCLNGAVVNVVIQPNGKIDTIYTNYKNKGKECDKIITDFVRKETPSKFYYKPDESYSYAIYQFGDFLDEEDKLANAKILTKTKNMKGANDFVTQKNDELYKQQQNELEERIREENELYELKKQKQEAQFEQKLLSSKNIDVLQYVKISSQNLGWVNCDRFIDKFNAIVYKVNTQQNATMRLIVKNVNAYFSYDAVEASNYIFSGIPKNEPVILISTYKKDGKIFLAIAETTTSNQVFNGLQYREISYSDLKKKLADLKI